MIDKEYVLKTYDNVEERVRSILIKLVVKPEDYRNMAQAIVDSGVPFEWNSEPVYTRVSPLAENAVFKTDDTCEHVKFDDEPEEPWTWTCHDCEKILVGMGSKMRKQLLEIIDFKEWKNIDNIYENGFVLSIHGNPVFVSKDISKDDPRWKHWPRRNIGKC